jgi:hypothetical protein
VDQVTLAEHRQLAPSQASSALNGLADHVAAVESARMKLGQDLDRLTAEVRTQMSNRLEKAAWKVVGTGGAILAGLTARKLLTAAWTKTRKTEPPVNPAAPDTSWGEALAWAAASGLVVAVGRLLAQRGAAAGWQKARGSLPPGLQEVA